MDPKPIKRSESIVKFSREHHFSLLFSWKIRAGIKKKVAPHRMIQYVRYFQEAYLQPHFMEEEEILFAPMQDEMVMKALGEHKAISESIKALYTLPEETVVDELGRFVDQLDEHVRYEERQLFPHLERTLSEVQLANIGRQLNALQSDPLQDDYEDEFWKAKSASL